MRLEGVLAEQRTEQEVIQFILGEQAADLVETDFYDKFPNSKLSLQVEYSTFADVTATGELLLIEMLALLNLEQKRTKRLKHYIEVGLESIRINGSERYHYSFEFEMARYLEINLGYKNIDFKLIEEFEEMTYEYMLSLMELYKAVNASVINNSSKMVIVLRFKRL